MLDRTLPLSHAAQARRLISTNEVAGNIASCFQNSVERSCRFSVVMAEDSALLSPSVQAAPTVLKAPPAQTIPAGEPLSCQRRATRSQPAEPPRIVTCQDREKPSRSEPGRVF